MKTSFFSLASIASILALLASLDPTKADLPEASLKSEDQPNVLRFIQSVIDTKSIPSLQIRSLTDTKVSATDVLSFDSKIASLNNYSNNSEAIDASKTLDSFEYHHIIVQTDRANITGLFSLVKDQIVSFIPDNAFLIRATLKQVELLQRYPQIIWVNILPSDLKISTRLLEKIESLNGNSDMNLQADGDVRNSAKKSIRYASSASLSYLFSGVSPLDFTKDTLEEALEESIISLQASRPISTSTSTSTTTPPVNTADLATYLADQGDVDKANEFISSYQPDRVAYFMNQFIKDTIALTLEEQEEQEYKVVDGNLQSLSQVFQEQCIAIDENNNEVAASSSLTTSTALNDCQSIAMKIHRLRMSLHDIDDESESIKDNENTEDIEDTEDKQDKATHIIIPIQSIPSLSADNTKSHVLNMQSVPAEHFTNLSHVVGLTSGKSEQDFDRATEDLQTTISTIYNKSLQSLQGDFQQIVSNANKTIMSQKNLQKKDSEDGNTAASLTSSHSRSLEDHMALLGLDGEVFLQKLFNTDRKETAAFFTIPIEKDAHTASSLSTKDTQQGLALPISFSITRHPARPRLDVDESSEDAHIDVDSSKNVDDMEEPIDLELEMYEKIQSYASSVRYENVHNAKFLTDNLNDNETEVEGKNFKRGKNTHTVPTKTLSLFIDSPLLGVVDSTLADVLYNIVRQETGLIQKNNAEKIQNSTNTKVSKVSEKLEQYVSSIVKMVISSSNSAVASTSTSVASVAAVSAHLLQLQSQSTSLVTTASLKSFASLPSTFYIDYQSRFATRNNRSRWISSIGVDPIPKGSDSYAYQVTPFASEGILGAGEIVGIADTGIDARGCLFSDSIPVQFHDWEAPVPPDNNHRKIRNYVDYADRGDAMPGHGTHVTGSVIGSTINTPTSAYSGIASSSRVSFFDIGVSSNQALMVPNDIAAFFAPTYSVGSRVHTNSWGCSFRMGDEPVSACNHYDATAFYFDKYTAEHPDFFVLVAAGNDGMYGHHSVSSPATSKNVLTVGANVISSEAIQTLARNSTLISNDYFLLDGVRDEYFKKEHVAVYSSKGPTHDGRYKPDVTGPGLYVVSASSGSSCGTLKMSGTSMATPVVAGNAILTRDYLNSGFYPTALPNSLVSTQTRFKTVSATVIKSILANSAQDNTSATVAGGVSPVPLPAQKNTPKSYRGHVSMALGQLYDFSSGSYRLFLKPTTGKDAEKAMAESKDRSYRVIIHSTSPCITSGLIKTVTNYDPKSPFPTDDRVRATSLSKRVSEYKYASIFVVDIEGGRDDENIGIELDISCTRNTSVSNGDQHQVQIAEYDSSTVDAATFARNVPCNSRIEYFPQIDIHYPTYLDYIADKTIDKTQSTGLFLSTPLFQYVCDVPACMKDRSAVYGAQFYTLDSSICRSAIHAGVFDLTRRYDAVDRHQATMAWYYFNAQEARLANKKWNNISSSARYINQNDYIVYYVVGSADSATKFTRINLPADKPNIYSGMGRIQLSSVLPLLNHGVNLEANLYNREIIGLEKKHFSRRGLLIHSNDIFTMPIVYSSNIIGNGSPDDSLDFSTNDDTIDPGTPPIPITANTPVIQLDPTLWSNVNDDGYVTRCFMISPKPEANIVEYMPNCENAIHGGTKPTFCTENPIQYNLQSERIRTTLTWNEPQSYPNAYRMLINDLDVHLITPMGEDIRGNSQNGDTLNNLEQATFIIPQDRYGYGGMYCAVVHGKYVPYGDQYFSLITSGRGIEQCLDTKYTKTTHPAEAVVNVDGQTIDVPNASLESLSGEYLVLGGDCDNDGLFDLKELQQRKMLPRTNTRLFGMQAGSCYNFSDLPYSQSTDLFNGLLQRQNQYNQDGKIVTATVVYSGMLKLSNLRDEIPTSLSGTFFANSPGINTEDFENYNSKAKQFIGSTGTLDEVTDKSEISELLAKYKEVIDYSLHDFDYESDSSFVRLLQVRKDGCVVHLMQLDARNDVQTYKKGTTQEFEDIPDTFPTSGTDTMVGSIVITIFAVLSAVIYMM